MTRYQLAKIVDWAGTLDTRKRMQKVVYLLQVAGCPLEAEYALHHYGPYSQEVALLTDAMVQAKILVERAGANPVGQQFSYQLDEVARVKLADFESSPRGATTCSVLAPFEEQARRLFLVDLKDLEYASTIVFFRERGHDWLEAVEKMCRFKRLTAGSGVAERAEVLARQVAG
ncbi:hypothetical protein [Singulisphaera sp. PoT]|uniref:hypothetical protein n=1 Tax=Singulisphaera sp. PoT TaxID=3411797 RepID=UPI003BF4B74F